MANYLMRKRQLKHILKIISLTLILSPFASSAQNWNDNQLKVWDVILGSYQDIDKRDVNWSKKWVTKDAMVWGSGSPMPRNRDSIKRWDNFQFSDGSTNNVSEYSPTAIVVHGNTAVAHYYYSNGTTSKAGKQTTSHGRCTDILVADKKSWKFVSWHCADEHKKH